MHAVCNLKPENENARLASLHELDLLGGQRFPELDRLTALAADICEADLSALTIYDAEDGVRVSVSSGEVPVGPVPRGETVCTHILLRPEPLVIRDALDDPVFCRNRFVHEPPYLRSYIGVPVGTDPRLPVGIICITHPEPDAFRVVHLQRLQRVADLINVFLEERQARLRADRAGRKTEEERSRQRQFELIFNAIHEGVTVLTASGRPIEANPASWRILGLTREELFGSHHNDSRWRLYRRDGSDYEISDFPVTRTLTTGKGVDDETMGLELPSGERRWISVTTVPLRSAVTQALDYAVITYKDITRQIEAEDRLNAQNAELASALAEAEKASRAKSDFLSVMSHELRTPMNAVLSCSNLLASSGLDAVQRRTLGVLDDAGRQMLALLNDLLDMSSHENGKVRVEREPVSLVRLIEDAAVIWAAEVKAKNLSLSVLIDPVLREPRSVDPARLLQIIGNLLANAIKFTHQGSVGVQAWLERGLDGVERVCIEVEDTGPGIPREDADRVFSPFEQVDVSSTRRHGGLGLGLHVARRLAVAMGGDIELDSTPGQGSRFVVRIQAPLADAPVAEHDDAQASVFSRQILCIDDNPRNLFVLGAMLRAVGHVVAEAGSGEEGLQMLQERRYDVILLDMVMPDMDGLEVLARLRAGDGPNARTPVIACTANVLPKQVEAYLSAGVESVLAKPIDPRAMLEAVAAAA